MSTELLIVTIILLFFLIILSAIFSAAETAYSSVTNLEIEKNLKKKLKSAKLIKKHYKSFGWTLATILISNNLVNVFAASSITYLFASFFSSGTATIMATVIMTPIIVIFGEIMPKLFAKKYPYKYLTQIVYIMEVLRWLFLPFTFFIKKVTLKTKFTNTENDLKTYLAIASKEGVLEKKEATLAMNALDLDSTKISNIFIPIKDVITVNIKKTLKQAISIFKKSGHSRLPVIANNEVVGVLLLKNVIFNDQKTINDLMVNVPKLSLNTIATKALEEMRKNASHMILIENRKKVVGILTLEDIIEELLGEIYDEHDKQISLNQISLHKFIATEKTKISEVEKNIGIKLNSTEKDQTVKQWISQQINRNFKKNLVYVYKGKIKFKVTENSKNGKTKIEVTQR